jgi:glycosyltransferase involved in cell wall biosynthesis
MHPRHSSARRPLIRNGLGGSPSNPVQSLTEVRISVKLDKRVAILTSILVTEDDRIMFSGADRYLVHLYGFLEESGYEPCVWQVGSGDRLLNGMKIQGLSKGGTEFGGLPDLNIQFFEHTVSYGKAIYFALPLAFPRVKPKSIVISHGIGWDYPAHPWSPLSGPLKDEWLRRLRYAVTASDLVVSVDTNTLNWLRATWPGYEHKQVYIPNFVDGNEFFPGENRGHRESLVIFYPRRLTWIRGLDDVKVVAEKLTRRYDFLEFHIVGRGGTDDSEAEMHRWAEENPRCLYYWVSMENMAELYRKADIVLIPTRGAEGTSLACLEAMACGKPVICGHVGGLTDLVIDGYNGVLINVSPETLEAAIEYLVLNPEIRQTLGRRALETSVAFSLERWKERWRAALRGVWGDDGR